MDQRRPTALVFPRSMSTRVRTWRSPIKLPAAADRRGVCSKITAPDQPIEQRSAMAKDSVRVRVRRTDPKPPQSAQLHGGG